MGAEEYDKKLEEQLRLGNEAALAELKKTEAKETKTYIKEVDDDLMEDLPPSLEEVSEDQRRVEELL